MSKIRSEKTNRFFLQGEKQIDETNFLHKILLTNKLENMVELVIFLSCVKK